jgi:hypothetical protein
LPELHGANGIRSKPEPHKVLLSADEFDQLLFIWEFCNNFSEYLHIPFFKIEELRLALIYEEPNDVEVDQDDFYEFTR